VRSGAGGGDADASRAKEGQREVKMLVGAAVEVNGHARACCSYALPADPAWVDAVRRNEKPHEDNAELGFHERPVGAIANPLCVNRSRDEDH